MNFLVLRYFVVVAQTLNISKAAENLFISQQALSKHIRTLEKSLGTPLFKRSPRLSLTYMGEQFLKTAKEILMAYDRIQLEIQDYLRDDLHSEIRLAITGGRMIQLFPDVLPQFSSMFPDVHITCLQGNQRFLEEQFRHENIDLIISANPGFPDNLEQIQLLEERLVLVVPKKFLLKLYPDPVQYKQLLEKVRAEGIAPVQSQLCQFPFLLLNKETRSRIVFEQYAMQEKLHFESFVVSDDFFSIFTLACEGFGICLCPVSFLTHIQAHKQYLKKKSTVEVLPVAPHAEPIQLRLFYRSEDLLSPPARYLRDLIVKACAKIGASTAQLDPSQWEGKVRLT